MPEAMGSGLCFFLGGIVVTLCGVWFTHVKNAVTRHEMDKAISGIRAEKDKSVDAAQSSFVAALKANSAIMKDLSDKVTSLGEEVAVLTALGERKARGHNA